MHLVKAGFLAVLAACVSETGPPAFAQQVATTRAIHEVRAVTLPAYDTYRGIEHYAPTRDEYQRAVGDRAFVMERLTYRSDDLDVYAYLYRPAAPPTGAQFPVVVFNRGSYVRGDFSPEVLMLGTGWPVKAMSLLRQCSVEAAARRATTKWEGRTSTICSTSCP